MTELVTTFVARRRLKIRPDHFREPAPKGAPWQEGQLVPEAHLWPRHESWLHTGHLGEVQVEPSTITSAFEEFDVPEGERHAILMRLGLDDESLVGGLHKTPFKKEGRAKKKGSHDHLPEQDDSEPSLLDGPVPSRDRKPKKAKKGGKVKNKAKGPNKKHVERPSTTGGMTPLVQLDE